MNEKLIYEEETYAIRGAIFEVYRILGDGYLEDVYQNALDEELKQRGIPFVAQKELRIMYKGRDCGLYRPDFICFENTIVEIKAVESLHPKHSAQLMNYLKATGAGKLGGAFSTTEYTECPHTILKSVALMRGIFEV